jgi:hypothetical protein
VDSVSVDAALNVTSGDWMRSHWSSSADDERT